MAVHSGTGNTAPTLTTVTVLLFIWAFVSFGVRIWVKLQKRDHWGLDDAAISIAVVAVLAQVIATCYSVHRGYGSPSESMSTIDRDAVEKSLFTGQIFYVLAIGFTKISTGLFTSNLLTRDPKNIKIARALVGLSAAWSVASIFAISLRGDLLQPWATPSWTFEVWTRWIGIEATGFALDILGAAMSTYLVWSLQMSVKKKLMVFAIFNCRLLIAVPVGFRLYYLYPSINRRDHIPADIVTEVVQGTTIIFACISCLKPFLSPFDAVAFNAGSAPKSGLFRYTADTPASRGDRYFELSGRFRSGDRKSRTLESTRSIGTDGSRVEPEDEQPLTDKISSLPTFRPPGVAHSAQARSTHWQERSGDHGKREVRDDHSINKTQTWTISVRDI